MKLSLERPLVFFDTETTGTTPMTDRIVSICLVRFPKGFEILNTAIDWPVTKINTLINPIFPIPKAATDIHGITDEMVKGKPTFGEMAKEILSFIEGCDIVAYNGNSFDIPLLYNEFNRASIVWDYTQHNFIDPCNIFKKKEPRTLEAAYKFYLGADMNEDGIKAHDAFNDVKATIDVFCQQLIKYEDLPGTAKELALYSNYDKPLLDISGKFTIDDTGDIVFNFGQHKGKKAKSEVSYLDWMVNNPKASFNPDTKAIAKKLLYPENVNLKK